MATLLLAALSFALLQTMVAPALPQIAEEYDTSAASASWVLTGFLLAASVATPIVGKLGDLYGKQRMLVYVLLIFAAGSVICALAPTVELVVLGRIVQGVAGGVFPLAFGIIRDTFPREKVSVGIGSLSAMFGIGGGIGLPLSGVIVDNLALHWLFLVGLLALPAALVARRVIPASPTRPGSTVDWAGAAILSAGLVALLLGVTKANDWGWGSPPTLGLILAGAAILAAWPLFERRITDPLVDLRILRNRAVGLTNLASVLLGFALFSSFLLIPQFAQTPTASGYGFGASITQAGLLLVPSSLAILVVGPLAGALGPRLGFRTVLALGAAASTLSFVQLALLHSQEWHFVLSSALLGVGIGLSFASMVNLIIGAVDQGDVGVATGINTISRTVGGAFGAAIGAAVLTADTIPGTPIPVESGYTIAFVLAAVGGLLALAATLAIPRGKRAAAEPAEPRELATA